MANKPVTCKHCLAIGKHYSFQCSLIRKPIERSKPSSPFKIGDILETSEGFVRVVDKKPTTDKKTLPELLKLTEIIFNKWIRNRDTINRQFKCISCGKYHYTDVMDAGHFHSKTYAIIRFHEDNCHGECEYCNRVDPNHLVGYESNLKNKIGAERFEYLYKIRSLPVKWDRQALLDIINKYKS